MGLVGQEDLDLHLLTPERELDTLYDHLPNNLTINHD